MCGEMEKEKKLETLVIYNISHIYIVRTYMSPSNVNVLTQRFMYVAKWVVVFSPFGSSPRPSLSLSLWSQ